jgi:hypothetical protein
VGNMPIRIEIFEDSQRFRQSEFYPVVPLLAMIGGDLQRIDARASNPLRMWQNLRQVATMRLPGPRSTIELADRHCFTT